ncbi:hypothetical protein [Phenylobacterium sp.]|uniref:hypothetical protein n=1 Tax=Phenylobacterium sp. TaxID=1871053 RepID=UPI0030F4563E
MTSSFKTLVTMFCIALALLYATASAASVLDGVQHQGQASHHHEHGGFNELSFDDHHQDGDTETNHDPGSGHHHHADGPQGLVVGVEGRRVLGASAGDRLAILSDHLIVSPGSPGPERPPKGLAVRV